MDDALYRAVILAAGRSRRMGAQKLLLPFRGKPLLLHAVEALARWKPLVIAGAAVAAMLRDHNVNTIVNDEPERGMTYSLKLADRDIANDCRLIVALGDKPLLSEALVERVRAASSDFDIAFPVQPKSAIPGHPVIMSPRARRLIHALPDGDEIRRLRESTNLRVQPIAETDVGAYLDIDEPPDVQTALLVVPRRYSRSRDHRARG